MIEAGFNPLADLPHARGDEPPTVYGYELPRGICPTHVGMNRRRRTICGSSR